MIDLDELKRLAGLVTPGPWKKGARRNCDIDIIGKPTWPCTRYGKKGEWDVAVVTELTNAREQRANAALICLLRNNLPTIIAALETAELVRSVPHAVPAAKLDEVAASAVDWDGSDIPENEPAKWETEAGVIRDMVAEIRAYRAIIAAMPKETDNG